MEEILMQNDSTLMLIGGIAVAVLLVILLVVVISSMKIKSHRDRLWDAQITNKEKAEYITHIEKELEEYKIKNARDTQELQQFKQTKETLKSTTESFVSLQSDFNELEKELSRIMVKLESVEGIYVALLDEHKDLQENNKDFLEENSRFRTNNARLLMKLESEARYTPPKTQKSKNKEITKEFVALVIKVFESNTQNFAVFSKENIHSMIKPLHTQITEFKEHVSDTYDSKSEEGAVNVKELLNVKELVRRAEAIYESFIGFSEKLLTFSQQYNEIQTRFSITSKKVDNGRGNLVKQVEQFKDLGTQTNHQIVKSPSRN